MKVETSWGNKKWHYTVAKNLEHMAAAHLAVESHEADIEKCWKEFKK